MKRTRRIGIVGRIDLSGNLCDGQTVKTRTVYRMLCERYGEERVVSVDTLNYRREPIRVLAEFAACLLLAEDIVVLLSRSGRRFLFPALFVSTKVLHRRIYHNLIGSGLPRDVRQRPALRRYLNSFARNWVESPSIVQELEKLGVDGVEYLPNFKQIVSADLGESYHRTSPVRFCTFSRVNNAKGVGTAVRAISEINSRNRGPSLTLDIYGPIDEDYRQEFVSLTRDVDCVAYKGVVSPEDGVGVLKAYAALLFPTEHPQEGMPGSIIDALYAGLPVLSARWPYYSDMLTDGKTGYSYPQGDPSGLERTIVEFLKASDAEIYAIRRECLRRSERYSAPVAFGTMVKEIEQQ